MSDIDYSPSMFELFIDNDNFINGSVNLQRHKKHQHIFGIEVIQSHANALGIAHGGMLATFADSALGCAGWSAAGKMVLTINLSLDYMASAQVGDFIIAEVNISKIGKRILYADTFLCINPGINEKYLARACGVFSLPTS